MQATQHYFFMIYILLKAKSITKRESGGPDSGPGGPDGSYSGPDGPGDDTGMCFIANYVQIAEKNGWPAYVTPGGAITKDDVSSDGDTCKMAMDPGFPPMTVPNCDCSDPDNFSFADEGRF